MNGKVQLIGDALAGFRPHTVASTSQADYNAMLLADLVSGKITHDAYVQETMQLARLIQDRGVKMGTRSQLGKNVPLKAHIADRNLASAEERGSLSRMDEGQVTLTPKVQNDSKHLVLICETALK